MKNKEDLKNYVIKCNNFNEKLKVVMRLTNIGFNVKSFSNDKKYKLSIVYGGQKGREAFSDYQMLGGFEKELSFQQFMDISKQFLPNNQKKLPDFEADDEGRVLKINNYGMSANGGSPLYGLDGKEHYIFLIGSKNGNIPNEEHIKKVSIGFLFSSKEARDKALFKLEIEQKLRTIAHRLNNGKKIDWNNENQTKYFIYFDYIDNSLGNNFLYSYSVPTIIFCLSDEFLDEAIKEIGEKDLMKYFKGE